MSSTAVFSAILTLLAGIGIFLIACQMMSSNLEAVSSRRLKNLFAKASKSKLLGVGIGTVGTAAIQSSGATTVMVIGFVNAGIISLVQAATIIYGANIGTTVTAQIVALGMFGGGSGLSTTIIFSAFAGVGAFMSLFSKEAVWKSVGGILTGFGMLFVGLSMMSGSMSDFAALDGVKTFLASIRSSILLVLIGAVFTAIIQSSSVMTSIAITMVVAGLVRLDQGIYLTMGSNIGSCVVALIAGLSSSKNAKRTALIHLIFNCSGVVIFMIIGWLLVLLSGGNLSFGSLFETMFPGAPQTQLAMFHTIFNVLTVVIILPLTGLLVNAVCKIVKDSDKDAEEENGLKLYFIDKHMLKTPPVAVEQTKAEIVNMADIAMANFNRSLDIITTMDYSNVAVFRKNEEELDFLNHALTDFVVKLSKCKGLSDSDSTYLTTTFRTVRDLERIGDYAENIIEYTDHLQSTNEHFSDMALKEIDYMRQLVNRMYRNVIAAYRDGDAFSLGKAYKIEEDIDEFTKQMEENHIRRLAEGLCTSTVGAQYLQLSTNVERVADHLLNVGKTIKLLKGDENRKVR